jgi:CMP-N,N'-diacetyllegionaminic acid synthase
VSDSGKPPAVALIPARGGSSRLPGKNVRPLRGHPLIAYTIAAAHAAKVFEAVVVSTDSPEIAEIAISYGAEVPSLRPAAMASSTSPDIEWVVHMLRELERADRRFEAWALLRPTSPLRSAESIASAFRELVACGEEVDSIRAVEPVKQHPGKMWLLEGEHIVPLLPQPEDGVPTHSRQYHDLPTVYVQDSSLEVSWVSVALSGGGLSGTRVRPWWPPGYEGLSVDYPEDWERLERLVDAGGAALPEIESEPVSDRVSR